MASLTRGLRERREPAAAPPPNAIDLMIDAAVRHLLGQRRDDGHWCAELEGDTILESEYVLLLHFLGRGDDPRVAACCERLRSQQQADGGWAVYPDGPTDPSVSVKAYLCLKLVGDDPHSPRMEDARRAIVRAGGLRACNSYTKLYLSIFGVWSWRRSPAVPPELVLLPRWFYFNLHEMSAWTRTIVVPLSVIWALRPSVPLEVTLEELQEEESPRDAAARRGRLTLHESFWSGVFGSVNGLIKLVEAVGPVPGWRRRALKEAEAWLIAHVEGSDGLGAIFPAMVNAAIAFRCLGYEESHPLVQGQLRELERFEIEEAGEVRLQPCFSPVWDTALSVGALLAADVDGSEAPVQEALAWLLEREVAVAGDWREKSLQNAPGGWCFEYRNGLYPDCDDTAEVLLVLAAVRGRTAELEARRQAAAARGLRWLLGMQNPDGGWASFDRCCDKEVLTLIPFADHNAMIDPSTPDITARVISALRTHGHDPGEAPIRRATDYLLREQEKGGSWPGRWGANGIYGTWLALSALAPLATHPIPPVEPGGRAGERLARACQRGRQWLLAVQNEDGGWGESLRSYDDPGFVGRGRSTAAQTAWAMMGLIASLAAQAWGDDAARTMAALDRAVAFLQDGQRDDGSWTDRDWTGVGFPRVFYLRYHGYAQYFPLEALAAYRRLTESPSDPARRQSTAHPGAPRATTVAVREPGFGRSDIH